MTTIPTKKQRALLDFIDNFIKSNGYSPSFREIMRALDYKSVSTVATHVDGLIAKGWLAKKDNSARSLEVIAVNASPAARLTQKTSRDIQAKIAELEAVNNNADAEILRAALRILEDDTKHAEA